MNLIKNALIHWGRAKSKIPDSLSGISDRSRSSRLFSLLLVFALLLPLAAHATGGDPNIEGGGGGMGEGGVVGDSAWNPGDDGVRVSVMQGTTAKITFDMSNVRRTRTQAYFVIRNKLYYKNGGQLVPEFETYDNLEPPSDRPLPTIIPSRSGGNNIAAIRSYFTDETVIRDIAAKAGMAYEELIGGDYKLLLEPIAYFKYNGIQYAMTATEAALFDVAKSGDLFFQMSNLTHQNLPLSMFLERTDLGILAWDGSTDRRQSNIDILNKLGCGIVSFVPEVLIPDPPPGDYIYRCDTDVITAALVPNYTLRDMTPSSNKYATFIINGVEYKKQMICPYGSSQYMWIKWHTPSDPCTLTVTVIPPDISERQTDKHIHITVSVEDLPEKTPPNPGYDGPYEGPGITHTEYRPNFRPVDPPDWGSNTRATWSQWIAELVVLPIGAFWKFSMATYEAALTVDFHLQPNERVPTATARGTRYIMGSGYGVDAVCGITVSAHATSDDVTRAQNVLAMFPEFDYRSYYRLLTPESRVSYRSVWGFKSNPYSYYGEPVHFTPVWYPDGDYTVPVAVFDAWTPGGMLYATVEDTVEISGSCYDDWYIRSY